MRAPSPWQPRARNRSLRLDEIDEAGPSSSVSAAAAPSANAIEDTSCSDSLVRRRRQERLARRALLRKQAPRPASRLAPRSGPPLSPSSFATDRFGAFLDSNLEREFWCWLNPQAVKTDATTLLMLFGVVGSTALAFAWQQSPWCLYTGTLFYFLLAVAYSKHPDAAARYRMKLMPWVRVSVLLMTVCNTWARKGTPVRPVGFLPSWLGTSDIALDADERDALLLRHEQLQIRDKIAFDPKPVPFTIPPRATSLEEASEPANWITFFFKVPRVYAIALPGVGFLLPPRAHALSTLACIVLIIGSVKTAAADREAFLGREMHEIVAGVLSRLTTALLGSLSPVVANGVGHGGTGGACAGGAGPSLSQPQPATAPMALSAASLLSLPSSSPSSSSPTLSLSPFSPSMITGRSATVAFLAANQVMSCHWVSVIHAALVRRERRRFEAMKRSEEEEAETEGDEGDDDEGDDADDGETSGGAGSERPVVRRKRATSSSSSSLSANRFYLDRTAEIDWLIGQAALHAAGWVAIWTAAEAWHRWKSR